MRRRVPGIVAAVAAGVACVVGGPAGAQDRGGAVLVKVADAQQSEVAVERTFVGTVRPTRTSIVGAEAAGSVVELLVREGDRVTQGQVLARQRTHSLELTLAAARAELELRHQELAEFEAGEREEDILEAQAQLDAATAARENAAWQLESTRKLFEASQVSETVYRDAETAAQRTSAQEREARAKLERLVAGPRRERIDQARARAEAQAARVGALEDALDRHTLTAPFDGWVTAERTEVGQWLATGDPVVEIAALDEVDVEVPVVEDFVHGLVPGSPARVRVAALGEEVFEGRVRVVVPRADERTRTFPVKIRVANRKEGESVLLKGGMFAEVTLAGAGTAAAVLVPKDALVLGGPGPMVWAVTPDAEGAGEGTVRPVSVETGASVGGSIVVQSEIVAGTLVVVQGNERLRPGQRVAFKAPAGAGR